MEELGCVSIEDTNHIESNCTSIINCYDKQPKEDETLDFEGKGLSIIDWFKLLPSWYSELAIKNIKNTEISDYTTHSLASALRCWIREETDEWYDFRISVVKYY